MLFYRLYAKLKGQPKFKALDLSNGTQVNNLIYATMIPQENLGKIQDLIELNKNNNVEFKIKKIK